MPAVVATTLEVVEHRQPLPGHLGPRLGLRPADLVGTPLARVVRVGEGPQPQVLSLGQPGLQVGESGGAVAGTSGLGPGVWLGRGDLAAAWPRPGAAGCFTHGG